MQGSDSVSAQQRQIIIIMLIIIIIIYYLLIIRYEHGLKSFRPNLQLT